MFENARIVPALQRLAIGLIASISTLAAQNFVPNPSFETHTGCPTSPGVFSIVGNWFVVPSHSGSPDYHHVCGNSTFGVPVNVFGNQLARTGQAYIGFVTQFGGGNFRKYLEVLLTSPLTPGTSYTATAYLSLSDGSGWATDGFGFYFSSAMVTGSGTTAPLPFVPQVSNPPGNFINSWVNWMPVSGTFVATPGLQYMTIGNFKNDATTGVQVQSSGWSWNYTYADDFSVTPTIVLSAELGDFTGELLEDGAMLQWDTRSENGTIGFEIEHSVGDLLHFERIATVAATGDPNTPASYAHLDPGFQPSSLNYYRLREIDQNGAGGYSNTIELHSENLVNEIKLTVYPNPVAAGNDLLLGIFTTQSQGLDMELIDLQGRAVKSYRSDLSVGDNMVRIGTEGLPSGCYVLRAHGQGLQTAKKIMVTQE